MAFYLGDNRWRWSSHLQNEHFYERFSSSPIRSEIEKQIQVEYSPIVFSVWYYNRIAEKFGENMGQWLKKIKYDDVCLQKFITKSHSSSHLDNFSPISSCVFLCVSIFGLYKHLILSEKCSTFYNLAIVATHYVCIWMNAF